MRIVIISTILDEKKIEKVFKYIRVNGNSVQEVDKHNKANLIIVSGPDLSDNDKKNNIETFEKILNGDDFVFYHVGKAKGLEELQRLGFERLKQLIEKKNGRAIEYSEAFNKELKDKIENLIDKVSGKIRKEGKKEIVKVYEDLMEYVKREEEREEENRWKEVMKHFHRGLNKWQKNLSSKYNIIFLIDPKFNELEVEIETEQKKCADILMELTVNNEQPKFIVKGNCADILEELKEQLGNSNNNVILVQLMSDSGFNVELKTLDFKAMEIIYHIVNDDNIMERLKAIYLFGVLKNPGIKHYKCISDENNRFNMKPFHNIATEEGLNVKEVKKYISEYISNFIPDDAPHFLKLLNKLGKKNVNEMKEFIKHFYPKITFLKLNELDGRKKLENLSDLDGEKKLENLSDEDKKKVEYELMNIKMRDVKLDGRKLYIIDDDNKLLEFFKKNIKGIEVESMSFEDFDKNKDKIEIKDDDIVLLDIFDDLLRKRGFEIAKELKKKTGCTALAFTSTSAYDPLTEIMKSGVFDGVVLKPEVSFREKDKWRNFPEELELKIRGAISKSVETFFYKYEHLKGAREWFEAPKKISLDNEDNKKMLEIILGCLRIKGIEVKGIAFNKLIEGKYRSTESNIYEFLQRKGIRKTRDLKKDNQIQSFYEENQEIIENFLEKKKNKEFLKKETQNVQGFKKG